ncbi:hypothetical protein EDB89DRAFT_289886 [Lactarius sanguifluus]|nr:hypothetical protein EDB89DRAFT_289886 [Lactarius sanguifluus]
MTSHHGCCRCRCKQLGIAWSLLRVVVGAYDSEALKVVRECRRGSSGDLGARRSFRWAWEAWEETSHTSQLYHHKYLSQRRRHHATAATTTTTTVPSGSQRDLRAPLTT